MANKGKADSKPETGANLGFEAKLWQMADGLRNNMDAAEKIAPASKVTQPVAQIHIEPKVPPPVAKLPALFVQEPLAQYPGTATSRLEKLDNPAERLWYVRHVIEQEWSHNTLALQISPQLAANLSTTKKLPGATRRAGAAIGEAGWTGEEQTKRLRVTMSEQQAEGERLDAATRLRRTVRQLSPSGILCNTLLHN